MILTTLCLGVRSFTGTVAAPQNDEKGLCRFRTVWLHLRQYRKLGVRPVLIILLSCIMGFHQAPFQFNQPYIILLYLERSIQMVILSYLWILPHLMVVF